MAEAKYEEYIVTELKKNVGLPSFRPGEVLESARPGEKSNNKTTCDMDGWERSSPDFLSECVWFFPGMSLNTSKGWARMPGHRAHTHPFEEVITFLAPIRRPS